MLMGEVCTRACRFCHVKVGAPPPLDPEEPENLARAVKALALEYIVVTSVNRDDRPDGGASHFAAAITRAAAREPRDHRRGADPRLQGRGARPGHGGRGAAARGGPQHRDGGAAHPHGARSPRRPTARSSGCSRYLKDRPEKLYTKSSIMVGLGETDDELVQTFRDLRAGRASTCSRSGSTSSRRSTTCAWSASFLRPTFDALQAAGGGDGIPVRRRRVRWSARSYRAAEFFMKGLMEQGRHA